MSWITLGLTLTLIMALLSLGARSNAEWRELVAESGSENVLTFRTLPDPPEWPEWTAADLEALRDLPGVEEVLWRGGTNLAQGPASAYVLPITFAPPGFLSARRAAFVAGRDLTDADAGQPRLVITVGQAATIFPDSPPEAVVGERVRVLDAFFEIVGVIDENEAAFRAVAEPVESFGRHDIQTVYLRLAPGASEAAVLADASAYLAAQERLAGFEAVTYREFVRPGAVDDRLDFVREIVQLFGWLVGLAVALAVLNLANQALLRAAAMRRAWALHRVLGASRGRLLARELTRGLAGEWLAIGVGVALGLALGLALGGLVTVGVVLSGLAIGVGSLLLGSLPLVLGVLRLYPYRALRESAGLGRHPLLSAAGALGLAVGLGLVILAGGFRDMGVRDLTAEIDGIGADLVEFGQDWGSILPAPQLSAADAAALREARPGLPVLVLELGQGTVGDLDNVPLWLGDEHFMAVSGTRLAAGAFEEEGVILGHALAAALFPEGSAVGESVTVQGQRFGRVSLPVAGVALPPTTAQFATLQLHADTAFIPRAALGVTPFRPQLYARVAGLSEPDIAALGETLSARHPGMAPIVPRFRATAFESFLARLNGHLRRFNLVALLIFALAALGVSTLLAARAGARRYQRGLERAFGAPRRQVFRSELAAGLSLTALIGGLGILAGLAAHWGWSLRAGYPFLVPWGWVGAAAALTLFIALLAGVRVARQSAAQPPLAVLRADA